MSQKYILFIFFSEIFDSLVAFCGNSNLKMQHFYDQYPIHFNILVPLHTGPNLKVSTLQLLVDFFLVVWLTLTKKFEESIIYLSVLKRRPSIPVLQLLYPNIGKIRPLHVHNSLPF